MLDATVMLVAEALVKVVVPSPSPNKNHSLSFHTVLMSFANSRKALFTSDGLMPSDILTPFIAVLLLAVVLKFDTVIVIILVYLTFLVLDLLLVVIKGQM